jgi:hypothetical protein
VEEVVAETALPAALRGHLVRERALLHRLAAKNGIIDRQGIDVAIEPTEKANQWEMVFRGTNSHGDAFRVVVPMYRRGRTQWFMKHPRVFINDVENDEFEGGLEEALAAALGSSNGAVRDTQGAPAGDSRGARSNAVETRRATVIRN